MDIAEFKHAPFNYSSKHYFIDYNLFVTDMCIISPLIRLLKRLIYKLIFYLNRQKYNMEFNFRIFLFITKIL
jgi:hypothetical protein